MKGWVAWGKGWVRGCGVAGWGGGRSHDVAAMLLTMLSGHLLVLWHASFQEAGRHAFKNPATTSLSCPQAQNTCTHRGLVSSPPWVQLFLNYRLSPHVPRPDWYTPVDAEEERRRWA